jgi:phosphoribosyl 1,2-cyclic phosphodiesterase
MRLSVIFSNSAGNAYILRASTGACLLIECGVRFDRIKQALGFNLRMVVGCLITHNHLDHCKAVSEILASGIDVYSSKGTHEAMGTLSHHRSRVLKTMAPAKLPGGFTVKTFDTQHDCPEPVGYLIQHEECGTVLFLTDSYYCEYNFKGLNNIIIEANYCQEIIDARVSNGSNPKFLRDRVLESHMSLSTCKQTLQAYDLSAVNNIVLIHLSDGNSDEAKFKKEVQEATGKTVHVATAGMKIDFNRKPF